MIKNDDYDKILKGNQGTIIKDFNALLSFIEEKGSITLTKSETAFNMSDLLVLNEIFSKPQKTGLSRPQQKAFPYINSLFLLLRLSLLVLVKKEKNKSVVHINPVALISWKQLKPVEQYGHLLTYMFHPEANAILGESNKNLLENISWLHKSKKDTLETINNKEYHGFADYQLAALDLFGVLSIKPIAPKVGKGWDYKQVSITPFGDDIIEYLTTTVFDKFFFITIDILFSKIKPLFPHWKKRMKVPKKEPQFGVHVFKISLGKAWRQIALKGNLDLHSFGDVILKAFEFDNDHLHEFSYKNQQGLLEKIYHYACHENLSSDEVLIGELNLQIGSEMDYLFDFGDRWRFHIVLEELDPEGLKLKKPVVLKKYGEAPPQYEDDLDDLDYFDIEWENEQDHV